MNLYLDVLGRRGDGFHELETLITPISLFDTLRVAPSAAGDPSLTLRVHDLRPPTPGPTDGDGPAPGGDPIPTGSDNLVIRALATLRERLGVSAGAVVDLWKRIPSRAGLGGGSSDAAAALHAGQHLWNKRLPPGELAGIAAEIGSDVPALLAAGATVCRGRGERVTPTPLPAGMACVLVQPPVGLGAGQVFSQLEPSDYGAPLHDAAGSGQLESRPLERLIAALRGGRLADAAPLMQNRLQAAAERLTPWIDRLRHAMAGLPVAAHQMSGSGSVYFGLCETPKLAGRVAAWLRQQRLGWVYTPRTLESPGAA
ncbi:MAG: 4-(cytidine 5'-diphospho)-2-C-methyl-D-erythritol kinase [Planctomycetota bacterium]